MTDRDHFLGIVKTQLHRSEMTYNAYIKSGKIFLYAKILKDCNNSIRTILIDNAHSLPTDQTRNALALIHHIDVWTAIWDDVYKSTHPTLMSVFTFANTVNFPREEADLLLEYYKQVSAK